MEQSTELKSFRAHVIHGVCTSSITIRARSIDDAIDQAFWVMEELGIPYDAIDRVVADPAAEVN